jgi:hypothetical protein
MRVITFTIKWRTTEKKIIVLQLISSVISCNFTYQVKSEHYGTPSFVKLKKKKNSHYSSSTNAVPSC